MGNGIVIDRVLVMDCETSGMNWSHNLSNCNESVAEGYQAVSWGLIITDPKDYKPIDSLYVEIKWNGHSKWDQRAEQIHGLTKQYLEKHGISEEDAVVDIIEFLLKNLDISKPIYCMGHNVSLFDLPFFKDLLYRYDIRDLKFGHRSFDSFSLSMGTVKEFDSDSLFKRIGMKARKDHNALEDAYCALEVFRRINAAWNQMLKKS